MFARRRKPTYWEFSVNCTGTEAHLSSCKLGQILAMKSNETCTGGMPVVVSCVPGRAFAPTPMTGYRKAFRQEVITTITNVNKFLRIIGAFYGLYWYIKMGVKVICFLTLTALCQSTSM